MNEPLTLEQLREMDGKVCRAVFDDVEPLEMLVLVEVVKNAGCVILRNNLGGCSEYYSDDEMRKDGLKIYAYPPAHIDREAWKPCDECKPSCMGCVNSYGWDRYGKAQACDTCEDYSNFEPDDKYCANCGRPMTEEAWKMIERRFQCGEIH